MLRLIHHNITASVPSGIHYHPLLICPDLTQFTYGNYVLCNSNWNTRLSLSTLIKSRQREKPNWVIKLLFHWCFNISSYQTKSPHTGLKKGDIHSEELRGDKSISCFPLLPFRPVGIPEGRGPGGVTVEEGGSAVCSDSGRLGDKTHTHTARFKSHGNISNKPHGSPFVAAERF